MSKREVQIGNMTVLLPGNLEERIETQHLTIVRYDFSRLVGELYERNIWAFDASGQLQWKIQRSGKDPDMQMTYAYSLLKKDEKGRVLVFNINDEIYEIRLDNGSLLVVRDIPSR